jgi:cell division protein FtsQ
LAARLPLPARGASPRAVLRAPGEALARAWANSRRARVVLVCAAIAVPVVVGGWMWFRQSSFVAVERVNVSGVHGPQAAEISSALRAAGRKMSTMQVNVSALRAAVAPFAVVREVRASPHFPHTLDITVVEQLPVAALVVGSERTAVAADGIVLGPALLSAGLPTVSAHFKPSSGESVSDAGVRAALSVLGAAPPALAAQVAKAYEGKHGLTLAMRNGLLVWFGDASLAHAKWRALETVLGDEGAIGASYVDVRLPDRPAAGGYATGAPPVTSSSSAAATSASANGTGSSVEAIAEALRASTGVSPGGPATGSESAEERERHQAAPSTGGESAASAPSTGGEEAASASPETTAPAGAETAQTGGGAAPPETGG